MEKAQSGVENKKYITTQSPTEQARGSPETAAGEQQPMEFTVTLLASRCKGCPKLPVPTMSLREPKSQKGNVLGTVISMYSRWTMTLSVSRPRTGHLGCDTNLTDHQEIMELPARQH